MHVRFPAIKPNNSFRLDVDDVHQIYVEECGDPDGIPVLFVHGGPGFGSTADDRRFFDPEKYRVILFDQRGAGRSRPHAELKDNTTQDLINDIEKIRESLDIDRWLLFGGSWGSTLSLLYAQAHPERVMGMVLRGIFLCRKQDLDWFYQHGASLIFPDHWQAYLHQVPENERDDMVAAYHRQLNGKDELQRMAAAKHWSEWEGKCATLNPNPDLIQHFSNPHTALALAKIENHFFANRCFIEENQILMNADRLKSIPGIIVHGRYDIVCPMDNAYALHAAWPGSQLKIVRDAGHASSEPAIVDALVHATNEMIYLHEK